MSVFQYCGRITALCAAAALSACVVGPNYRVAPVEIPRAFAGLAKPSAATPLSRPVARDADLAQWWRVFADPELDALIRRALADNLDRATAASRIREARRGVAVARARLSPAFNANPSVTHTTISKNSGLSSLGSLLASRGAGGGAASGGAPGLDFDTFQVGFDASWELDLFGAERRQVEAANARAEAQIWNGRDTDVSLTAQVAQEYLMLRADEARLAVVAASVASQTQQLAILSARSVGGLTNDVDAVQQRAQIASTQSRRAPLEASVEVHEHALSTLLALPPESLAAELTPRLDAWRALPRPPPTVPIGLPSDLLERRPDIRQAERQLAAATADVGAATAELYPRLELTGAFDLVSSTLRNLLESSSRNDTFGGALTAPLFDGGRLRAQKHQAEERMLQARAAYRKAVLSALQEVADALSRYGADQRRLDVLRAGRADAERAVSLDRVQYVGGLADLQATLRAQDTVLSAEDQIAQTEAQLATDLVALFKALGGGWREGPTPSPSSIGGRT